MALQGRTYKVLIWAHTALCSLRAILWWPVAHMLLVLRDQGQPWWQWGEAAPASSQMGTGACDHPCGSGEGSSLLHPQGDVSSWHTRALLLSPLCLEKVFECWGKASGFHSTQLTGTMNSVLVFPCTMSIIIFINRESKHHLRFSQSSLNLNHNVLSHFARASL